MKKNSLVVQSLTLCLILTVFIFNTYAQSITRLVGASPFQDSLWVFDTTNMAVVRGMAPTPSSGNPIEGMTALAKHPVSGAIYIVSKQTSTVGRTLGTINLNTAVVNIIGNLGDNFSSITFNGNNTLLGVTGDGANVPETLYRININDATSAVLAPLGLGADGEVICYNPTDNMIYHWSGNTTVEFEKFDTAATTFTILPVIGTQPGETFGMVHVSGSTFIGSNINSAFNIWDTTGAVGTDFGLSPDDIRGMAFITCDRAITGTLSFCTGDSTLLTGTSGGFSYQWYRDGVAIAGATGQTYYASIPGSYNVIINDVCSYPSSADSLATGVVVQELALPSVALTGNNSFCTGDSTLLTGTSGGTSQWYLDGVAIAGATNNTYYATAPGVYNMIKTNLNGCSDSASVGIIVVENPLPAVALSAQSLITCLNQNTNLLTGNPPGGTFSGPGVSGNNFDPSAAGVGTHDVVYTYTDSSNCTNADTIQILVDPCTGISQIAHAEQVTFVNPFDNILHLNLGSGFGGGTVSIFNLMGQQFVHANINTQHVTLNTSSLSPGVYFIRITSAKGTSVYKSTRQ